jgi:hypothetical protein
MVARAPAKWASSVPQPLYFQDALVHCCCKGEDGNLCKLLVELLGGTIVQGGGNVTHVILVSIKDFNEWRAEGVVFLKPSWILHAVLYGGQKPQYCVPFGEVLPDEGIQEIVEEHDE